MTFCHEGETGADPLRVPTESERKKRIHQCAALKFTPMPLRVKITTKTRLWKPLIDTHCTEILSG
jgi:hypothetical protein